MFSEHQLNQAKIVKIDKGYHTNSKHHVRIWNMENEIKGWRVGFFFLSGSLNFTFFIELINGVTIDS